MSAAQVIRDAIAHDGPIPLTRFIELALGDPETGYYRTRDPLGQAGDFITAPEISQMFGELIGLWMAVSWQMQGSPTPFVLAELGPGRGTLMADLLRAAAQVPGFVEAASVHLVETSPVLRDIQASTLAQHRVHWSERVEDMPEGPLFAIANEFFDALPVDQFCHDDGAWRRRLVTWDAGQGFHFTLGPATGLPLADAPGKVFEICQAGLSMARTLGGRIARDGGALLMVDYGHAEPGGLGDTVQSVKAHRFHPVLDDPGEADITAHVNFAALAEAGIPARAHGPVTQGTFLKRLGIETRAAMLAQGQTEAAAQTIAQAMRRLIDPAEMGTLFKVMALAHPALPALPGLEPETAS